MLFALINWLVIFLTTYPIGYFLLKRLGRKCGAEKRIGIGVAAGLVTACVYAQIFSLFYRVSWEALLLFATLSVVCTLVEKGEPVRILLAVFARLRLAQWITLLVAGLMIAYCNSVGAYLPDTDMYHAQAIRWIEEYGVVKGLGNAIRNTAYNSSFFPLTALYSMKYIFGRSLHTVQGFWILLTISQCTGFVRRFWKADFRLSDFARVGAIYYATLNYRALVSPSSDYAVMFPLFLIVIWFLELVEKREEDPFPFIVLCMIGCNCVTTKMSAGVILLLSICPIVMLVRKGRFRTIINSVLAALLIVIPYLIRNVILSGWLLYPSTTLDLFDVPWKMPKQVGEADVYQIHVWGWDVHDNSELVLKSLITWIPHWFSSVLSTTEKVLVVTSFLVSTIVFVVLIIRMVRYLIRKRTKKCEKEEKTTEKSRLLMLLVILSVEYCFWQYSAPLPRYGYAYLILLPLIGIGIVIIKVKEHLVEFGKKRLLKVLVVFWTVAVICFIGKKVAVVLQFYPQSYLTIDYIKPIDYTYSDENEAEAGARRFLIDGICFRYHDNPSYLETAVSNYNIGLLGEEISEGFCVEYRNEEDVHWIE